MATIKQVVTKLGKQETEMRNTIRELRLLMGFNVKIEYDGQTLTRQMLNEWEDALDKIDEFAYYV